MSETAIAFECEGTPLVGIAHRSAAQARRGVVMVVGGGPQYRVGGHRQLVLWSRRLASQGYPVFRFDYRGMGDSHGTFRGFEHVEQDIRAAIDRFQLEIPGLEEVILWGECDAASAILFYAHKDDRVKGLVLLNPWVRTEEGEARTILRHYYIRRLMQPSFWRKVRTLKFNPATSLMSLWAVWRKVVRSRGERSSDTGSKATAKQPGIGAGLPERMLAGWKRFTGPIMLVMSGRDLIAREFDEVIKKSGAWLSESHHFSLTRHDLENADHTFSTAAWRTQVVDWALDWLNILGNNSKS